jgi:hypothetical protein
MRTIYIIGIDNDPDGCYITDALEKPEHTIAGNSIASKTPSLTPSMRN